MHTAHITYTANKTILNAGNAVRSEMHNNKKNRNRMMNKRLKWCVEAREPIEIETITTVPGPAYRIQNTKPHNISIICMEPLPHSLVCLFNVYEARN